MYSVWQCCYCDHMITARHTGQMTGPWKSRLITAENAQQITGLFSCVDFVISACLTIPDQYSIKETFFAFSLSVASRCKKKKKDPKDEREK